MSTEPYASAKTVYWIVDNGSSHAGKTSVKRMQERWANARLIHLPSPRVVAEPNRAVLLDPAAQGAHPQRPSPPWTPSPGASSASASSTGRSPARSSGPSPATSSTNLIDRIDRNEPQLALVA